VRTVGVVGADADGGDGVAEGDGAADNVYPLPLGPTTASKCVRGLGEGVNVAVGTGDVFVGGAGSTASAAKAASRASKGAARVSYASWMLRIAAGTRSGDADDATSQSVAAS